jgi:hypothetical protein
MKKLLFVLIAVVACSCTKDPRDIYCGEYEYVQKGFMRETIHSKKSGYMLDTKLHEIINKGKIIIRKSDVSDSNIYIERYERNSKISFPIVGRVVSDKRNSRLYLLYSEIPNEEFSDVNFSDGVLSFTITYERSSVCWDEEYFQTVIETTYSEEKWVATKIKEQD